MYDKNDNLLNAMQEAINMSPIEYREKQNNLYEIAKRLQNEATINYVAYICSDYLRICILNDLFIK